MYLILLQAATIEWIFNEVMHIGSILDKKEATFYPGIHGSCDISKIRISYQQYYKQKLETVFKSYCGISLSSSICYFQRPGHIFHYMTPESKSFSQHWLLKTAAVP